MIFCPSKQHILDQQLILLSSSSALLAVWRPQVDTLQSHQRSKKNVLECNQGSCTGQGGVVEKVFPEHDRNNNGYY